MRPPDRSDVGSSSARRGIAGWLGGGSVGLARGVYGGVRWPDSRLQEVQGHTVRVLVVSQALGGLGMSIGIAVAALLAEQVSGRCRWWCGRPPSGPSPVRTSPASPGRPVTSWVFRR
jgi:hypothetical protein